MRFASLHAWVTYLIAGLGLAALGLALDPSPWVAVPVIAGFVGSWFFGGRARVRPGWALFALLVFMGIQVVRAFGDESPLYLAVEFTAALQVSRLYVRRSAREYQQIAILAFLHLIVAAALTTELAYAAIFVSFVIAIPWMLTLSHLRHEIEANYGSTRATSPEEARAHVRRVLASKRVVGSGLLLTTTLFAIPIFAITAGLFMLFPRVGLGMFTFGRPRAERVAGFGSSVELGDFGTIQDDPTIVARVRPPPGTAFVSGSLRLRGTSFDRWDGTRWTRQISRATSLGRMDGDVPIVRFPRTRSDMRFRVSLEPIAERVLFLPVGTVALSIAPRVQNGVPRYRAIEMRSGLDLRYGEEDALGMTYDAWISSDPGEQSPPETRVDPPARAYLALPPNHGAIAALASRITRGASSNEEKAKAILRFLRDERRFTYSLTLPETRGRPPLDVFLFEARRGHCEYFASAMAVMLRAVGVPARNVTGFVGGRWNPYGGYFAIRQGDAHSWVEAHVEGRGWVTYDPTPPTRARVNQETALSKVDAMLDALRARWVDQVVSFDLPSQVALARKLASLFRSPPAPDTSGARNASTVRRIPWAWFAIVAMLSGFVAVRVYRRRTRGDRSEGNHGPRSVHEVAALYHALERVLEAQGHPRPAHRTPTAHAEELQSLGLPWADDVAAITRTYLELRYSGRPLERATHDALMVRIRAIASQGTPSSTSTK